jgi:hypothetical protein
MAKFDLNSFHRRDAKCAENLLLIDLAASTTGFINADRNPPETLSGSLDYSGSHKLTA